MTFVYVLSMDSIQCFFIDEKCFLNEKKNGEKCLQRKYWQINNTEVTCKNEYVKYYSKQIKTY